MARESNITFEQVATSENTLQALLTLAKSIDRITFHRHNHTIENPRRAHLVLSGG